LNRRKDFIELKSHRPDITKPQSILANIHSLSNYGSDENFAENFNKSPLINPLNLKGVSEPWNLFRFWHFKSAKKEENLKI
jgi:hypothetical protein